VACKPCSAANAPAANVPLLDDESFASAIARTTKLAKQQPRSRGWPSFMWGHADADAGL